MGALGGGMAPAGRPGVVVGDALGSSRAVRFTSSTSRSMVS